MTQWSESIQGIPTVQPLYADDWFVGILLVCFFIVAAVLSDQDNFLGNLVKEFFLPRKSTDDGIKTSNKFYMRLGLYGVTFMSMALFFTVFLVREGMPYAYRELLLFFVAFMAIYILKQGIYRAVNWVFFDRGHIMLWRYYYSNWIILSGISIYLVAAGAVLFDLCSEVIAFLLVLHVSLTEMCLFFKAFQIFSSKKYGGLQLFVYLCTLELIPLLLVGKGLVIFLDN